MRDRSRRREERDANDLHKIDEHPLTSFQTEKMKNTIDEDIFSEIPPPEDDDEDPWNNIEKDINDRHLIKNSVFKKAMTWDEWYTDCDAMPYQTYVTIRKQMENESEPEVIVKNIKLRITSDLDPSLSPSSDETHDDPPYHKVPRERPAALLQDATSLHLSRRRAICSTRSRSPMKSTRCRTGGTSWASMSCETCSRVAYTTIASTRRRYSSSITVSRSSARKSFRGR